MKMYKIIINLYSDRSGAYLELLPGMNHMNDVITIHYTKTKRYRL